MHRSAASDRHEPFVVPNVAARVARLQDDLRARGPAGLLVTSMPNVRYLTGFTGTTGVLWVGPDEATLFVDGRYTAQARSEATAVTVRETVRDVVAGALASVREAETRGIGIEAEHLSAARYLALRDALPDGEPVPTEGRVEALRGRKDDAELDRIRRAVAIADAAYEDFVSWVAPGMSEREVAIRIETFQRSAGGDRKEAVTMVSSGPRTGYPHGVATDRTLCAGEPVMIDIGVTVDGYGSDLTRTVHLGPPAAEFEAVHTLIDRAMEAAIRGVRPGRAGREIDALARAEIEGAGYGERFGHGLGHSVGLQGHEPPNFAPAETAELAPGMVVTVEPGVYLPDRFGVRTEDMILVTEDGCEVLTRAPRELRVVALDRQRPAPKRSA